MSQQNFENIRALIVDDNPMDRTVLKAHLEAMGITQIQEAPNGKAGLFRLETSYQIGKPIHLLVTDWKMPEQDGLKLLKEVRAIEGTKNMAIIMVTAVYEMDKVAEVVASKVDAYIIKPADFDKFKDRVDFAIRKRGFSKAA